MGQNNIEILPVPLGEPLTPQNAGNFNLAEYISQYAGVKNGDVIVITSKIISLIEGRCIKLETICPSKKTKRMAKIFKVDPAKLELIRQEGKISFVIPMGRLLKDKKFRGHMFAQAPADLSPEDRDKIASPFPYVWVVKKHGHLADSAGIDTSNIPEGYVALLPKDPAGSALLLRKEIKERYGASVSVIITDTLGSHPGFQGYWDIPLGFSGLDPLERNMGAKDLFGKKFSGGRANFIFPISSMAGFVMGNCSEKTPITVFRGLKLPVASEEYLVRGHSVDNFSTPKNLSLKAGFWTAISTLSYFFVWAFA